MQKSFGNLLIWVEGLTKLGLGELGQLGASGEFARGEGLPALPSMARRSITGEASFLRNRTISMRTISMRQSLRGITLSRGPSAVRRAASAGALPSDRLPAVQVCSHAPRQTQPTSPPQAEAHAGMHANLGC